MKQLIRNVQAVVKTNYIYIKKYEIEKQKETVFVLKLFCFFLLLFCILFKTYDYLMFGCATENAMGFQQRLTKN